jgi:hypothetical protein
VIREGERVARYSEDSRPATSFRIIHKLVRAGKGRVFSLDHHPFSSSRSSPRRHRRRHRPHTRRSPLPPLLVLARYSEDSRPATSFRIIHKLVRAGKGRVFSLDGTLLLLPWLLPRRGDHHPFSSSRSSPRRHRRRHRPHTGGEETNGRRRRGDGPRGAGGAREGGGHQRRKG